MDWSAPVKVLCGLLLALWAVGEAGAQIVAPGGRTLFNRGVMVRSVVRLDQLSTAEPRDSRGRPQDGIRSILGRFGWSP